MGIPFFTPIHYPYQHNLKLFIEEKVDSYFYLGGKTAKVLFSKDGRRKISYEEQETITVKHVVICAFKIASYVTFVLPAIFLIAKVAFRIQHYRVKEIALKSETSEVQNLQKCFPFADVLKDHIPIIFSFLDANSLILCSQVAKKYHDVVQSSPFLLSQLMLHHANEAVDWIPVNPDYRDAFDNYSKALRTLIPIQVENNEIVEVEKTLNRSKEYEWITYVMTVSYLAEMQIKNLQLSLAKKTIEDLKQFKNAKPYARLDLRLIELAKAYQSKENWVEVEAIHEELKTLQPTKAIWKYRAVLEAYRNDFVKCREIFAKYRRKNSKIISIFIKNKKSMIVSFQNPCHQVPIFLREVPTSFEIQNQNDQINDMIHVSSQRYLGGYPTYMHIFGLTQAAKLYRENENLDAAQEVIKKVENLVYDTDDGLLGLAEYYREENNQKDEDRILKRALEVLERRFDQIGPYRFITPYDAITIYLKNYIYHKAIEIVNRSFKNQLNLIKLIASHLANNKDCNEFKSLFKNKEHQLIFEFYHLCSRAEELQKTSGFSIEVMELLHKARILLNQSIDPKWRFDGFIDLYHRYNQYNQRDALLRRLPTMGTLTT